MTYRERLAMKDTLRKYTCYLVFLIIMLAAGCSGNKKDVPGTNERIISVSGRVLAAESRELKKNFTGTLEGEKQAVITAKIAEAVEKVAVKEGMRVNAEDVIISLDRTGPTSNYIQAQSVFQNAEKTYQKMQYLYTEGAVSETEFDGAKTAYEVAQANFEAARKVVEIRTPITGTVTSINVSPGEYVYPGQQVATVASIDKLRMKPGVSGSDLHYFQIGGQVRVFVESSTQLSAPGHVATVARSADPVTRTFQVEIEVDNSSQLLKPGMFARAEIVAATLKDAIIVPREAVIEREDKNIAFIVSGGKAVARDVILGTDFDGYIEIKEGLSQGDTLVVVGQNYLDDGYGVNLVNILAAEREETAF
jgi:membrane fusion protein (multidrug efflux system)